MTWFEDGDNVFTASFSIANDRQADQIKEAEPYEYEGTYYN